MQYWTPNKNIFDFEYANNITLEECQKRQIDVHFGWELIKVAKDNNGEKYGVFKNVDTGKIIEKEFNQLVAHPPAKPH